GLANHGRGLARDRGLGYGGDACDHLGLAGDDLAALHDDHVSLSRLRGGDLFFSAPAQEARQRFLAEAAQGGGLGLASALRQRFRDAREDERDRTPTATV